MDGGQFDQVKRSIHDAAWELGYVKNRRSSEPRSASSDLKERQSAHARAVDVTTVNTGWLDAPTPFRACEATTRSALRAKAGGPSPGRLSVRGQRALGREGHPDAPETTGRRESSHCHPTSSPTRAEPFFERILMENARAHLPLRSGGRQAPRYDVDVP
jgi:hypothetical protein